MCGKEGIGGFWSLHTHTLTHCVFITSPHTCAGPIEAPLFVRKSRAEWRVSRGMRHFSFRLETNTRVVGFFPLFLCELLRVCVFWYTFLRCCGSCSPIVDGFFSLFLSIFYLLDASSTDLSFPFWRGKVCIGRIAR